MLKTLIKQHDSIEREVFDDKEVDLQTKEKYFEAIFRACCQTMIVNTHVSLKML